MLISMKRYLKKHRCTGWCRHRFNCTWNTLKSKQCELSVNETLAEIQTNALSTKFVDIIANKLEAKRSGTICVISSVAGDRGRASNYVYGSAKAMVTAFTSGLRQRLHKSNVAVVTIKSGFVDTPMTSDFKKGYCGLNPHSCCKYRERD